MLHEITSEKTVVGIISTANGYYVEIILSVGTVFMNTSRWLLTASKKEGERLHSPPVKISAAVTFQVPSVFKSVPSP